MVDVRLSLDVETLKALDYLKNSYKISTRTDTLRYIIKRMQSLEKQGENSAGNAVLFLPISTSNTATQSTVTFTSPILLQNTSSQKKKRKVKQHGNRRA